MWANLRSQSIHSGGILANTRLFCNHNPSVATVNGIRRCMTCQRVQAYDITTGEQGRWFREQYQHRRAA